MRIGFALGLCWLIGSGAGPACWGQSPDSAADEAVLAGHSYHGEAFNEGPRQRARLMEGLGHCHFPVTTTSDEAQKFFNQGIDQLHGFWYFEAERSFRQAVMLDPDCAMACWGLAMANINNAKRARQFIGQAQEKANEPSLQIPERETMWINSLAAWYDEDSGDKKKRAAKYAEALEEIVLKYPDDIEARAFLVCQIWMNQREGIDIASHVGINALLDEVFAVDPWHPAHHYRIHLWDYRKPEQALQAAARCGPSLPAIAHMWHMPGHIYSRLKRYDDAVWQQEASARVDHSHMMRDRVMPDQIHNFAHNNEWCIRNLNYIGRVRDAIDLATNMIRMPRHPKYNTLNDRGSAWYGRQRLLNTLSQYELWQELISVCDSGIVEPAGETKDQVFRLRHLGRACFRSGQTDRGNAILADLNQQLQSLRQESDEQVAEKMADAGQKNADLQSRAKRLQQWIDAHESYPDFWSQLRQQIRSQARLERQQARDQARKKFAGDIDLVTHAILEMRGYQALAAGDRSLAHQLLTEAGEVDPIWLAWVQLPLGDRDAVLQAAQEYVQDHENEVQPLAMLTWLLLEADEPEPARDAFARLRAISGSIDMQSPVFARLAERSDVLGIDGDWRIAAEPASDLGQRPDLDSLGPFRWGPAAAPLWQLVDADQKTVSLKQFQGQPVLVIFYLGHGCLHCAEQLQEFAPGSPNSRRRASKCWPSVPTIWRDFANRSRITGNPKCRSGCWPIPNKTCFGSTGLSMNSRTSRCTGPS